MHSLGGRSVAVRSGNVLQHGMVNEDTPITYAVSIKISVMSREKTVPTVAIG